MFTFEQKTGYFVTLDYNGMFILHHKSGPQMTRTIGASYSYDELIRMMLMDKQSFTNEKELWLE